MALVACTSLAPDEPDPTTPVPQGEPVVRKEVQELTAQEKADFVAAVTTLKKTPAPDDSTVTNWYDSFVAKHLSKLICWSNDSAQAGYGHNGPDLLTWHRALLREFEVALTEVAGKPLAIPYWDWTDERSTAVVFSDDFMGGYGDPDDGYAVTTGPFRKDEWTLYVRGFESTNPGQFDHLVRAVGTFADASELPSADEVQQALLRTEYDVAPWTLAADPDVSFRQYVDGTEAGGQGCVDGLLTSFDVKSGSRLHATVHMWVGGMDDEGQSGALMDTATSPNDPVFWLHHANIDRIAEAWWAAHAYAYAPMSGGPNGNNYDDEMDPFAPLTNGDMAVPTGTLGYVYDRLPTASGAVTEPATLGVVTYPRGHAHGH